ncbi:FAD dependent oxidoreductase [Lentinula aciculospora]|uniref:FAD dependent oxidoreductase n=1 Tax=Lentinula aciculospora TaxID=153920 RepID=A0A9W9DG39_9AGAR|nr:FAD dependent oxidoreductase [Lentinula aciculospora]
MTSTVTLSVPTTRLEKSQHVFRSTEFADGCLPVENPTKSLWIDSPNANPLAKEGSTGFLPTTADICIIGSGITGVSVAYHLATRSIEKKLPKVVILEARDFCSGATGRNGGHLTPNPFINFSNTKARYGQQEALKALDLESHTAKATLDFISSQNIADEVDLVAGGHITMFVTGEEFLHAKEDYDAVRAAGVDLPNVEWLSKEEMLSIYGVPFPGARYGGHNLWLLKLVTHLYNFAKAKLSLSVHTFNTTRGSISCSYIVHATNAYASHLLPHLRGPSGIVPTRGQVVTVRASVPVEKFRGRPSWDANDGFEYWFPRPVTSTHEHPLVVLGGGREVESRFEHGEIDDSRCNEVVGKILREFLPGLFPGKFEARKQPEMEWTGIMGFTESMDPFVGPVDGYDVSSIEHSNYKGQFIAAGYSGHGMPRAYACAEVVASMIIADLQGERWTAPNWLPHHYLTSSLVD